MTADPNSREVGNQLAIDGIQVESDALAATADVDFCDREQESRSSSSPKVSNLEPSPVSSQETRPLWEYIWGIGSNIERSVDQGPSRTESSKLSRLRLPQSNLPTCVTIVTTAAVISTTACVRLTWLVTGRCCKAGTIITTIVVAATTTIATSISTAISTA